MKSFKALPVCVALAASFACAGALAASPSTSFDPLQGSSGSQDAANSIVTYSFTELDLDHNGRLNRAEIPLSMHDLRRQYMEADFSGDGQLSPQECYMYAHGTMPTYTGVEHAYNFIYNRAESKDSIIAAR